MEALLHLHKSVRETTSLEDEEKMAIEGLMSLRLSSESPVSKSTIINHISANMPSETGSSEVSQIDSADTGQQNKKDVSVLVLKQNKPIYKNKR